MQLGEDFFVYRLESKTLADKASFTAEEQQRINTGLTQRKRGEVLDAYVRGLRQQAMDKHEILVEEKAAEEATVPATS